MRKPNEALVIVSAWTAVAALFTGHNYLSFAADGAGVPLFHAVWWSVAEWYTWALLTPLVIYIVRRHGPTRRRIVRSTAVLFASGIGVAALQIGVEYAADRLAVLITGIPELSVRVWLSHGAAGPMLDLAYLVPRKIGFGFATFWCIVLVVLLIDYYRLYRDRELHAARLENALVAAQLEALQARLQPHFLFNTLNAIASLIPEDPAAAEEMVESLSDLLRATLLDAHSPEVALSREIELVRDYLHIQELRFPNRLCVTLHADPETAGALVPSLVLQPLAENAVHHGIARLAGGGSVSVRAVRDGGTLVLTVEDDGPGFADSVADGGREGLGLANTRARLTRLYGDDGRLEIENRPGGGARTRVSLPYHTAAVE